MDKDSFTLDNQTYSDINNILLGIINDLQQISNSSHENLTINPLTSLMDRVTVFTSPYLRAGAPVLGEAKGLIQENIYIFVIIIIFSVYFCIIPFLLN